MSSTEDIWLSQDESESMTSYLVGASNRIQSDFLQYFKYVPLRHENLELRSQRLADFIPREYALLSKAFVWITFGQAMRNYCERSLALDLDFGSIGCDRQAHMRGLYEMYEKRRKNEDTLNSYYKFHNANHPNMTGFWNYKTLSEYEIRARRRIGIVEFPNIIRPFEKKAWNKWNEARNTLTHRTATEATLKDALHGVACIHGILEVGKRFGDIVYRPPLFEGINIQRL